MKNIYHILYAAEYWITREIFGNKEDEPEFASIVSLTVFLYLAFDSLYCFVTFQLLKNRELTFLLDKKASILIGTILLLFNLYYFNTNRRKTIIQEFYNLKKRKKLFYIIVVIIYDLFIFIMTIIIGGSIAHNIYWFEKDLYFFGK